MGSTLFRDPQARSSAFAALGTLQPRPGLQVSKSRRSLGLDSVSNYYLCTYVLIVIARARGIYAILYCTEARGRFAPEARGTECNICYSYTIALSGLFELYARGGCLNHEAQPSDLNARLERTIQLTTIRL